MIASCMLGSCPEDEEVLGIGDFLDKLCLRTSTPTDSSSVLILTTE